MPQALLSDDEVRALNERFETAHPRESVRWALRASGHAHRSVRDEVRVV